MSVMIPWSKKPETIVNLEPPSHLLIQTPGLLWPDLDFYPIPLRNHSKLSSTPPRTIAFSNTRQRNQHYKGMKIHLDEVRS
ncbi:hypothetical protein TNCV_2751601 [Trichonephila clavipes]|nr:hypothetical protein TNCV_2751601 [Trichonephila clavipes]